MPGPPVDTKAMLAHGIAVTQMKGEGYDDEAIAKHLRLDGAAERVQEILRVWEFWPLDLMDRAAEYQAPWHTLFEATRDHEDPNTIVHKVREYTAVHKRWPAVGYFRRLAGRPSNHRLPGEGPGQESLL